MARFVAEELGAAGGHSMIRHSSEPVISRSASGVRATVFTQPECPVRRHEIWRRHTVSSARRIASFASGVPRRARESSTGKGLLLDALRFINMHWGGGAAACSAKLPLFQVARDRGSFLRAQSLIPHTMSTFKGVKPKIRVDIVSDVV